MISPVANPEGKGMVSIASLIIIIIAFRAI